MPFSNYCRPGRLVEMAALAVTYVISAWIGQIFAIPPGNITPVWFPPGIMFAWVFLRGYYVWPGIFIGAYIGNTLIYADYSTVPQALSTLVSGTMYGAGSVAFALVAVYLFRKYAGLHNPVSQLRAYLVFLLAGVIACSVIDTLFTVTGLGLGGYLPSGALKETIVIRLVGDMAGTLLVTPLILINFDTEQDAGYSTLRYEKLLYVLLIFLISMLYLGLGDIQPFGSQVEYFILPLLLWSSIRFKLKATFISAFYFSVLLMISQTAGNTAFPSDSELNSILGLQFFIILTSTSVFILGFIIKEREQALNLIRELNHEDVVGGVYTRQFFRKSLNVEIRRQMRSNTLFSLIMLEVRTATQHADRQAPVDESSFLAIANIIGGVVHDIDLVARWQEHRLIILMPGIGSDDARGLANRILDGVAGSALDARGVFLVAAIAEFQPGSDKETVLAELEKTLARCDGRGEVACAVIDDRPLAV